LIDSVLAATPTNAPLYPQGLFWRATLASNAADAESDYKHIVVDYPLAPQAEDALLRLAQLELARGDREGALIHLQRIPRDYPRSKSLARASYWTARVLFEKNDIPSACAANASALAQTGTDEIELRNQIQYQGQRCPSSVAPSEIASPTAPVVPTERAAVPSVTSSTSGGKTNSSTLGTRTTDSAGGTTSDAKPKPVGTAPDANPSITSPVKEPAATASKLEPRSSIPPRENAYSIQVAAYNRRPDAEKLAARLVKQGYQARVDGDIVPFRVRIGRYPTEREAEAALKRIKAKHMDGFVARAPER
jgi:cell division protein FtsN